MTNISALILACFLMIAGPAIAADISTSNIFIDIDGDGFDDNELDNDKNGIPDRFEETEGNDQKEVSSLLGNVFNAAKTEIPSDLLSNGVEFGKRKFETRLLWQCHRGICSDDQFGPGNGIGLGAAACAGGVCGI